MGNTNVVGGPTKYPMPYDLRVPGWMKEYDLQVIEKLARRIPPNGSMVEIGSFLGRSSVAWAMSARPSVLITCIDLWSKPGYFEKRDRNRPDGDLSAYTGAYEGTFRAMTGSFPNVTGIRGNSTAEYGLWDQDLVFLDGDHHFGAVKADLANWSQRLKTGGLLCGHDFGPDDPIKGVVHAVMSYSFNNNCHIFCPAHSRIWMLVTDPDHLKQWWPC